MFQITFPVAFSFPTEKSSYSTFPPSQKQCLQPSLNITILSLIFLTQKIFKTSFTTKYTPFLRGTPVFKSNPESFPKSIFSKPARRLLSVSSHIDRILSFIPPSPKIPPSRFGISFQDKFAHLGFLYHIFPRSLYS